jgi:ferrochelatase
MILEAINNMSFSKAALLMLGFGGPQQKDEIRPFIEKIVSGRNVPKERIDTVVEQYNIIGGKSPYVELTFRQAKAIEEILQQKNNDIKIYCGMLHSEPSIENAIGELQVDGIDHVIVLVMAPQRTEISFERYKQRFETLINSSSLKNKIKIDYIDPWYCEPLFIKAICDQITKYLAANNVQVDNNLVHYIFTAHSIPIKVSDASTYDEQVNKTAYLVASQLSITNDNWSVAYQSRSGDLNDAWLEPDVLSTLENINSKGKKTVILIPIGFVVDHVEVLYDLDILAVNKAREIGLAVFRVPTVSNNPLFIELLAKMTLDKALSSYAHRAK